MAITQAPKRAHSTATEPEPAPTSQMVRPGAGPSRASTSARTSALVIIESRCSKAVSGSAQVSGAPWWPASQRGADEAAGMAVAAGKPGVAEESGAATGVAAARESGLEGGSWAEEGAGADGGSGVREMRRFGSARGRPGSDRGLDGSADRSVS